MDSHLLKTDSGGRKPPNIRIATRTDVGLRRVHNEDSLATLPLGDACVLVVCDGMGGHHGGAEASALAVEVFLQTLQQSKQGAAQTMPEGVQAANWQVFQAARNRGVRMMGTTLVAAVIQRDEEGDRENDGHQLHLANVGDSRAYLFRDGRLQQLTNDHSHVAELIASGALTKEQAAQFPGRNVITRALGSEPTVIPDLFQFPLHPGDTVLLATDGLHSEIEDERIAEILRGNTQLNSACDALVVAALAAGGGDNITVILAQLQASTEPTAMDSPATVEGIPETSLLQLSSPPAIQRAAWLWAFGIALMAALAMVFVWRGVAPIPPPSQEETTPATSNQLPDTSRFSPPADLQPTPGEGLFEGR